MSKMVPACKELVGDEKKKTLTNFIYMYVSIYTIIYTSTYVIIHILR